MIEFKNVYLEINDGKTKRNIIDNVTFKIPSVGFFAIEGISGSGKSTIFNLISHEVIKTSGTINVFDVNYDELDENQEDYLRKNVISYITQENQLFNNLTVKENINIILNISGINEFDISAMYNKYLSMLKLENLLNDNVNSLSGGEKQRLSIFLSILRNTNVILADEPTSSLDENNSIIVMDTLSELSNDRLVLITSHNLCLIEKYGIKSLKIHYGKIVDNNISVINDINIEKKEKTSSYNIYKTAHMIFSYQKIRIYFSIFIISILMILNLIALYNISFNKKSFSYDAYSSTSCDYFIVSDSQYIGNNNYYYSNSLNYENMFEYYYDVDPIKYYDVFNTTSSDAFAKNVIIDDTLGDYEIKITDYLNNELNNEGVDSIKNLDIVGVLNTNYKDYEKLDSDNKSIYSDFMDLWYKNIVVNKNTFKYLAFNNFDYDGNTYYTRPLNALNSYSFMFGSEEINDNEIIITPRALHLLLNGEENEDLKTYLDSEINIEIFDSNYTFIIKGFYAGDGSPEIVFSDEMYNQFASMNSNVSNSYVGVRITSKNNYYKLYDELKENKLYLINPYNDDVDSIISERNYLKTLSIYLYASTFILLSLVTVYINYNLIKTNERTIGILRHYGISRKDISTMILFDRFKLCIINNILAIFFYSVYYILNNRAIIYNTLLSKYVLDYKLWIIIIFVFLTFLIEFFSFIILMKSLKKKDNKTLLTSY